jgi:AbrB family looped-hinge helix DNA binding protein
VSVGLGSVRPMRVTVDRVGRIVIPKRLRDALGIGAGTRLELVADGAGLRLEPVPPADRPIEESDGLPILGSVDGAVLTDDDVRNLRSRDRVN